MPDLLGLCVAHIFGVTERHSMNYKKGDKVEVTDYRGARHVRVVYGDFGDTVAITSDSVLEALNNGDMQIQPIAVPKHTVSPVRS